MCRFVSTSNVMPGWACCGCSAYNGLQRQQCRGCGGERHPIDVPADLVTCEECGFGFGATGIYPCPCCQHSPKELVQ